jgi:hypothetical protein
MKFNFILGLALLLLTGCQSAKPPQSEMSKQLATIFVNNRLKAVTQPDAPIKVFMGLAIAEGFWLPEDSTNQKLFAEQVEISCNKDEGLCHELTIPLGVTKDEIRIMHAEETLWPINSWNDDAILASYGPVLTAKPGFGDRCLRHVMSLNLDSGAVSSSVVPTNEAGCEKFQKTDASRLVYGNLYVDTTPGNDVGTAK